MNYEGFIYTIIFCHFIGDYVFQTAWISKQKKFYLWPMIVHCIIYTGCIGYALIGWRSQLSIWDILFIFNSHFIIDKFRIAMENKRDQLKCRMIGESNYMEYHKLFAKYNICSPGFIDQCLHFLILLALIVYYK